MLEIGSKAPGFTLPNSDGADISLSDYRGKKNVVLYFYPEDDTPACTIEAQQFSDTQADYEALETVVLGVSPDTVTSHKKFCQKYGLKVTLLADPDHIVLNPYEAWGMKSMMGRDFMGTIRCTYLIDKEGTIRKVWPKVTAEGHEKEVLEAIQSLDA